MKDNLLVRKVGWGGEEGWEEWEKTISSKIQGEQEDGTSQELYKVLITGATIYHVLNVRQMAI